jgi:hypothetical protein
LGNLPSAILYSYASQTAEQLIVMVTRIPRFVSQAGCWLS